MEEQNQSGPFEVPKENQMDKPVQSENVEQVNTTSSMEETQILETKKKVDVVEILNLSWNKFKQNWEFLTSLTLIYFGIRLAEGMINKFGDSKNYALEFLVASILIAAFNALIAIGVVQIYLKISRGQQANYGDILGGTKYFWKLIGGTILYVLIVLAGYLLLIIPGIIWQYKYSMFSYLLIDKDLSPMDAIRESGKIMDGFKWKLFFLQLLMLLVILGGALLLGVGLLAAIPVVTLMSVNFYRIISGEQVNA